MITDINSEDRLVQKTSANRQRTKDCVGVNILLF